MANLTNAANLAKTATLTIFCQRLRFKRMSPREGFKRSGEFNEVGENGEVNNIFRQRPRIWRHRLCG